MIIFVGKQEFKILNKMNNYSSNKVGAEPKKRIRHVFYKEEGIHEGIHRDEPGWYDCKYHCYCFGYGYFFHQGKGLGKKLTPDYIKDNWDKAMWCGGLKDTCMAIINRKRKIAVIRQGTEYAWSIEKGLPEGYTIYKTDEEIPIYDITEPKNKKILINMYVVYLIQRYLNTFTNEYKVFNNSRSKYIPEYTYDSGRRKEYFDKINSLVNKYKFIPKHKPLKTEVYYINNYKVQFPSIEAILNDELFTDEQKAYIHKCKFYTKFCLHKGISWKELNKKWSDDYAKEIEDKDKADHEAFIKKVKRFEAIAKYNYEAALAKINNNIDDWREGCKIQDVKYITYSIDGTNRKITPTTRTLSNIFTNTQLRLRPNKPNWVETSRGAVVPLDVAINIFNQLYTDYILSGKTQFKFQYNQFRIGSFYVSRCEYIDKYNETSSHNYLGYKEWCFVIGCHTLWFDDIKDFARYYNLQDRLSFPLDKTTAECMENHLIHLPSGRTIEAIGTIDI